jgi:hypothetical protein
MVTWGNRAVSAFLPRPWNFWPTSAPTCPGKTVNYVFNMST